MAGDPGIGYRTFWRWHGFVDRITGGRVDVSALLGQPALWLTTLGRRTGEPRVNALWYITEGLNHVVVASHVGSDRNPAWFLNLMAHPDAEIRVGRRRRAVRARRAWGPEAERLWAAWTKRYPRGARYRHMTEREIPIVVLEPR